MSIDVALRMGSLTNQQSLHLASLLSKNSSKQSWVWLVTSLTPQRVVDSQYMEQVFQLYFPKSEIAILQLSAKLKDKVLPVFGLWPLFKLIPCGPPVVVIGVELLKAFLPRIIRCLDIVEAGNVNLKGWFNVLGRTVKELEKANLQTKAVKLSKSLRPILVENPTVAFHVAVWFRSARFFQCALRIVDQVIKGTIPPPLKQKSTCIHTLKFKLLNDVKAKNSYYDKAYNDCLRTNLSAAERVRKLHPVLVSKMRNRQKPVRG